MVGSARRRNLLVKLFVRTLPRNGGGYQIAPECLPPGKTPPETDAAITFTKRMTEQGPIVQHD